MQIRALTRDDALQVAEMHVASWKYAYKGVVPDSMLEALNVDERAQRLRDKWKPDRLELVAVVDGKVIGFTVDQVPAAHGYDCEIGALYVHPSASRQGCGKALVQEMVERYLERGCRTMCIHTLRDNRIGQSFYEQIGGVVFADDIWREIPSVWYGWEDISALMA